MSLSRIEDVVPGIVGQGQRKPSDIERLIQGPARREAAVPFKGIIIGEDGPLPELPLLLQGQSPHIHVKGRLNPAIEIDKELGVGLPEEMLSLDEGPAPLFKTVEVCASTQSNGPAEEIAVDELGIAAEPGLGIILQLYRNVTGFDSATLILATYGRGGLPSCCARSA